MRLRSLLAVMLIGIAGLGFSGCGSNGNNGSEFLATTVEMQQATTGNLTFNFVTAQTAYTVSVNSATLRFDFYEGAGTTPVFSTQPNFATSVTVSGVPVNADRVVITGFDANGFPLYTIDQAIDVIGGETTVVPAVSNAVAVQLMELRLVSGDFSDLTTGLTTVSVASGGTFQVFLIAEYDNGTLAIVGDNATYAIAASGSAIASVNNLGTISGLSVGNTTFTAEFGGQTLTLPVAVTDGLPINFSSLIVENTQPIEIATGTPVTLTIVADNMFGLSPSDSRHWG